MIFLSSLLLMIFLNMSYNVLSMSKTYNAQATQMLKDSIQKNTIDLQKFEQAIANKADIHVKISEEMENPLRAAILLKDEKAVKLLLDAGALVNSIAKYDGKSPLMFAVSADINDVASLDFEEMASLPIVKLLLDNGADINAQQDFGSSQYTGSTALMIAVKTAQPKIVEYLLQRGARTDIKNKQNKTVFDMRGMYRRSNLGKEWLMQKKAIEEQIQDMLKLYKQRPEVKEVIAAEIGTTQRIASIVTGYLFGEEPKQSAASGAAEEVKKEVARST